jgi:membrane-associated protease RseP (regulator of RpoE activity)
LYPDNTAESPPIQPLPEPRFDFVEPRQFKVPDLGRLWLHILLLILTVLTTTIVGSRMQFNFIHDLPAFDLARDSGVFLTFWRHPAALWDGVPFSLTLITILLAHEFGHYLACVYYGLDATLPFFIPFPSPIGTMGAFIRIKSAIYSRRVLFDVGIAGPIAGFVFLLPALSVGLAFSKVVPGINHQGSLTFGVPPVLWLLERVIFPGVHSADIYLHPVVRAGWVGVFATALNLLPIGQSDGGHILYALFGEKHRWISRGFVALLVPLGFYFWDGWAMWALVLFLIARRHPAIYDLAYIGRERVRLGVLAAAMFALCFMLAPISNSSLLDVIREFLTPDS